MITLCTNNIHFLFQELVISCVYVMFLILMTFIFSIVTWDSEENHRESRWICITACFTIAIWIVWTVIATLTVHRYVHLLTVNTVCAMTFHCLSLHGGYCYCASFWFMSGLDITKPKFDPIQLGFELMISESLNLWIMTVGLHFMSLRCCRLHSHQ